MQMAAQDILLTLFILFVALAPLIVFFFPEVRWQLRKLRSSKWPQAAAIVHMAGAEYIERTSSEMGYNRSLFGYSYQVAGLRYAGFFALVVDSLESANILQRKLEGRPLLVRYHPAHPDTSIMADHKIEGLEAMQSPRWIRPGTSLQQLNLTSLSARELESLSKK